MSELKELKEQMEAFKADVNKKVGVLEEEVGVWKVSKKCIPLYPLVSPYIPLYPLLSPHIPSGKS